MTDRSIKVRTAANPQKSNEWILGSHFTHLAATIIGFDKGTEFTVLDVMDCFHKNQQQAVRIHLSELRNMRILEETGETFEHRRRLYRVSDEARGMNFLEEFVEFENMFSSKRSRRISSALLLQLREVSPETHYIDLAIALGVTPTALYNCMREEKDVKLDIQLDSTGHVPYYVTLTKFGRRTADKLIEVSQLLKSLNIGNPLTTRLAV